MLQTEGKNAPKTLCFNLKNQLKAPTQLLKRPPPNLFPQTFLSSFLRHLCLCCALLVKDEDFAKAFAEEGGMDGLMGVAAQATGNVQTYALVALRVAISHSSGPAPASPASLLPPQRLLS